MAPILESGANPSFRTDLPRPPKTPELKPQGLTSSDPSCHYGPTDLAAATGRSLTAEELHQLALETTQKVGNSTYWMTGWIKLPEKKSRRSLSRPHWRRWRKIL